MTHAQVTFSNFEMFSLDHKNTTFGNLWSFKICFLETVNQM